MIRPATLDDIRHIGRTMWERGRVELGALGIGSREWVASWLWRMSRGDAVAFDSHAILGCDWEGIDVVNTSFQASTSFEQPGVGLAVTKEIRRAIPQLMKDRGIRIFNTYSLCVDPSAPKWFRLLGLEEDMTFKGAKHGPYTARRFFRRA